MEFATFLALIAAKFAESFGDSAGKSAGEEFGKRLGIFLSDAILGKRLDEAEMLKALMASLSGIVQQALDQDNIRQAMQLVCSGNFQLKQYRYSNDQMVGVSANKTFADAFGVLQSHKRTAIETKVGCAVGHVATVLLLAYNNKSWRKAAVSTIHAYIEALSDDLALVEKSELETVSEPEIKMTQTMCRYMKSADLMVCANNWVGNWSINSEARGEVPRSTSVRAGRDGEELMPEETFKIIVEKVRGKDLELVAENKRQRDQKLIEPTRKLIADFSRTIERLT